MTKDYEEQLNAFSVAETRSQAELYFSKYWLNKNELFERWLPIQNSIFDSRAEHLPDMMFKSNFELFPLVGGNVFLGEKDFTLLQDCMRETGDSHFVIIQNENVIIKFYEPEDDWIVHPPLRFKYPVNTSWDELMSGGYISIELFQGACKDFFIFGDSSNWGRYAANDYVQPSNLLSSNPLIIMGFKNEYSEVFKKNFEQIRLLEPEITPEILFSEWLPDSYKQRIASLS